MERQRQGTDLTEREKERNRSEREKEREGISEIKRDRKTKQQN